MWVIVDWNGLNMFPDREFGSFEAGWDFIHARVPREGWGGVYVVPVTSAATPEEYKYRPSELSLGDETDNFLVYLEWADFDGNVSESPSALCSTETLAQAVTDMLNHGNSTREVELEWNEENPGWSTVSLADGDIWYKANSSGWSSSFSDRWNPVLSLEQAKSECQADLHRVCQAITK